MSLFNRTPKFRYEFSKTVNFIDREVTNYNGLITLLEDENYRLNQEGSQAEVTITKIRNKTGIIIHDQHLSLPYPDGTDFDDLCEWFARSQPIRRAVVSEPPIGVARVVQSTEKNCWSCDYELGLSAQFCSNCGKAQTEEARAEQDPVVEDVVTVKIQEETPREQVISAPAPIVTASSDVAFPEIEVNDDVPTPRESVFETSPESVEEQHSVDLFVSQEFEKDLAQYDDSEVGELLDSFKDEVKKVLSAYMVKEKTKIDREVSELDKRAEIPERVTHKYQAQEETDKKQAKEVISRERAAAISEENRRHQAALQEIDETFNQSLEQKLSELTSSYRLKIEETIATLHAQETEILAKILQGKTAELSVRQKALNQGLQDNFISSLTDFNQTQSDVIRELNKIQSDPQAIHLDAYRKRAAI
ncbi:hypothetical protein RyT2_17310 [Pseudolactococcus yaeyamensis]